MSVINEGTEKLPLFWWKFSFSILIFRHLSNTRNKILRYKCLELYTINRCCFRCICQFLCCPQRPVMVNHCFRNHKCMHNFFILHSSYFYSSKTSFTVLATYSNSFAVILVEQGSVNIRFQRSDATDRFSALKAFSYGF